MHACELFPFWANTRSVHPWTWSTVTVLYKMQDGRGFVGSVHFWSFAFQNWASSIHTRLTLLYSVSGFSAFAWQAERKAGLDLNVLSGQRWKFFYLEILGLLAAESSPFKLLAWDSMPHPLAPLCFLIMSWQKEETEFFWMKALECEICNMWNPGLLWCCTRLQGPSISDISKVRKHRPRLHSRCRI